MSSFTASMCHLRRGGRGRPAGERGQAMLEFALILPFILLIVLGMLDIGKAMHYRNDLTHLANEAARAAAVDRSPEAGKSIEEAIRDQATSDELRDGGSGDGSTTIPLEVFICFPEGDTSYHIGDPVRAIVRSEYRWLDFLGFGVNQELKGSSTMRIEKDWHAGGAYSQPVPLACP